MICAIMQPTYFPWIGYFDLIDQVDKFIFLDNVKLEKSTWQVRNRIKSANGEILFTIPIKMEKGRMKTNIHTAEINQQHNWKKKHLKSINYSYKKSEFYNEVYPFIENLFMQEYRLLNEWNIYLIKSICKELNIDTQIYIASKLNNIKGTKDTRLVSICQNFECNKYLSPVGSSTYLDRKSPGGELVKNGIHLYYQNYKHPAYVQLYNGFISHLSVIDLLFNCGFESSLDVIRSGRRDFVDYITV